MTLRPILSGFFFLVNFTKNWSLDQILVIFTKNWSCDQFQLSSPPNFGNFYQKFWSFLPKILVIFTKNFGHFYQKLVTMTIEIVA